jgi:hypothetical protein
MCYQGWVLYYHIQPFGALTGPGAALLVLFHDLHLLADLGQLLMDEIKKGYRKNDLA